MERKLAIDRIKSAVKSAEPKYERHDYIAAAYLELAQEHLLRITEIWNEEGEDDDGCTCGAPNYPPEMHDEGCPIYEPKQPEIENDNRPIEENLLFRDIMQKVRDFMNDPMDNARTRLPG